MKTTTLRKYYLEYVTVHNVPMVKTAHGYGFDADVMGRIEKAVAKVILMGKIPLRGKEVQFIRKAFGLSARALGDMLAISHVAVRKWEKNSAKRLEPINEIAVRAVLAKYIHIDMYIKDAILTDVKKPTKIEVNAAEVAQR